MQEAAAAAASPQSKQGRARVCRSHLHPSGAGMFSRPCVLLECLMLSLQSFSDLMKTPTLNTAAPLLSITDCMIFLRHHITPPHPRWGSTHPFLIPIATMYSTWGRFSAMMPMPPPCMLYRPQGQKGLHRPAPHPPRSTEVRNLQQHPNAPAVNTSSPKRGDS